jgi:hypothetical protein
MQISYWVTKTSYQEKQIQEQNWAWVRLNQDRVMDAGYGKSWN